VPVNTKASALNKMLQYRFVTGDAQHLDNFCALAIKAVFSSLKKYYAEKRFSVTSNLRYMHGVLNIDEIKN
jgi:hypothetical protein